ncbi:MAG: 4-hydroxy-3-methylbut-2-enyl diphosphate reductase [Dehalococcoidales bacterium]|mgnify:CR=1 FL=1|jgi:4-hydroxy-3-methylbut-2-enyl diphosphate reductase|nr:4-hydroxy-3-methylbut-2-enyl diphosphate reductase [Dehalococcoidales bacterium]|tara:strand:- start:189 stop:1043 length:855 start_codon:yes stop_codon:yes gene_type:complete
MTLRIEKAAGIGFCFGVKRAIDVLEKVARERGSVETLGAVVHNRQVLQRLAEKGVRLAQGVDDIQGDTVAIGTHGVGPQQEDELRSRYINIINTTCPFVHRAQIAARRLAKSGFFVIIYGEANHTEVRGVLDWAGGKGVASLDEKFIAALDHLPRRLGILSQTTQIPACFTEFVKRFIDFTLVKDAELRIIDTICHDIRERQEAALRLANRVDLMLVIGGHNSANTKHLTELCSTVAETYSVETAEEIQPSWFRGKFHIGVTAGASTAEETINEVITRLKALDC